MLNRFSTFWKPGTGAAFSVGTPTFDDTTARANTWTANHTFATDDDLVIVALSFEDNLVPTVAADPSGANIPLSEIVAIDGAAGSSNVRIFGSFNAAGLGLTGAKAVDATFGGIGAAGSMAIWTAKGAARLPTTGDFATDDNGGAGGNVAGVTLALSAGEVMLAGLCNNATEATTAVNITKVHEITGATGGQTNAFYQGTASDPGASWTTVVRLAFAAVKVVPA